MLEKKKFFLWIRKVDQFQKNYESKNEKVYFLWYRGWYLLPKKEKNGFGRELRNEELKSQVCFWNCIVGILEEKSC